MHSIRRRRDQISLAHLSAIGEAFAAGVQTLDFETLDKPSQRRLRDDLRFAIRLSIRHPGSVVIPRLIAALEAGGPELHHRLVALQRQAKEKIKRRQENVIHTKDMLRELRGFAEYLAQATQLPVPPVTLEAESLNRRRQSPLSEAQVVAYTDGKSIYLPAQLATTHHHVLHEYFLYYLVAHEFAHLAAGSFDVDLSVPSARKLDRFLRWYRRMRGIPEERPVVAEQIRLKLESESLEIPVEYERLPDRAWILSHFAAPDLAASLFNAIVSLAAGRRFPFCESVTSNRLFRAIRRILENQTQREEESVYDSLYSMCRIVRLLEKHGVASNDAGDNESELAQERELRYRLVAKTDKAKPVKHEWLGPEDREVDEPGFWLPEVIQCSESKDAIEIEEQAVYLVRRPFRRVRDTRPLEPLELEFPLISTQRVWDRHHKSRLWSESGARIANDRIAEHVAARRAGQFDYPLSYDERRRSIPQEVILLFDLSVSMEAPRKALSGQTALDRSVQLARWITRHIVAQHIEVTAYGGIDGGRRPVIMIELGKATDGVLTSLHAIGTGGFRIGAHLRALAKQPVRRGKRRMVFVFTDAAAIYHRPSILDDSNEKLRRVNCPACNHRAACVLEPNGPQLSSESNPHLKVYSPPILAWTDVTNAIQTGQHVQDVHVFALTDQLPTAMLNHCLGPTHWSDPSTQAGIYQGVNRLRR